MSKTLSGSGCLTARRRLLFQLIHLFLFRLIFCISHSTSSAFSLQGRNIRFLRTAFNTVGEAFAAGDHQGNIFVFDLAKNRYA